MGSHCLLTIPIPLTSQEQGCGKGEVAVSPHHPNICSTQLAHLHLSSAQQSCTHPGEKWLLTSVSATVPVALTAHG